MMANDIVWDDVPKGGEIVWDDAPAKPSKALPKSRTALDYMGETIGNIPASAGRLVSDVAGAVMHPIDTVTNVVDVAAGGLRRALPKSVSSFIDKAATPEQLANIEQKSGAVGEMYKQRYGGGQNIADTVREDPIGVLGDVAAVLGGAGGALKLAPAASRAAKVGQAVSAAGNTIDPIMAMGRGAGKVASGAGNVAKSAFGAISNIDPTIMEQAYKSGKTGEKTFVEHMRGQAPSDVTVGLARDNLQNMRGEMGQRYANAKGGWANDTTQLDFTPINDKFDKLKSSLKYKDKWTIGDAEMGDIGRMENILDSWRNDPTAHTVEGLDALKRALSNVHPDPSHRQANRVATALENTVKEQIYQQAPQYAPAMKDYHQRINQINEIEKTLSLGDKASIDTAMRKLQSTSGPRNMRRAELLDQMEEMGGVPLRPALAGQVMSEKVPKLRGLGGVGVGALGALATGNPLMLGLGALSSPRLVGEALHGAGKVADAADSIGAGKVVGAIPKGVRAGSIATPLDEERVKYFLDALRQNQEQ
jgi:hypothetical protein